MLYPLFSKLLVSLTLAEVRSAKEVEPSVQAGRPL
jgi:hypothetical protein